MDKTLGQKHEELKKRLKAMCSVLVSFSGGVDSSLVLAVACDVLGSDVVAATIYSELHPQGELKRAEETANSLKAEHLALPSYELEDPIFISNPPERCYYCKHARFSKLVDIAAREGISEIIDGTQLDDLEEYRPGVQAAKELGVGSPLAECGFFKYDVRALSRVLGLPNWNHPPTTCLASRIPYGEDITQWKLTTIHQGEEFLRSLGLFNVRVRLMGKTAVRIEISPYCLSALVCDEVRDKVVAYMRGLGFTHITGDLEGYRSSSMDEALV